MAAADHFASFQPAAVKRLVLVRAERSGGKIAAVVGAEERAVVVRADLYQPAGAGRDLADARHAIEDLTHLSSRSWGCRPHYPFSQDPLLAGGSSQPVAASPRKRGDSPRHPCSFTRRAGSCCGRWEQARLPSGAL